MELNLNSNEYMVLADSLSEGGYAVSSTERHFAWQEGSDVYDASVIPSDGFRYWY